MVKINYIKYLTVILFLLLNLNLTLGLSNSAGANEYSTNSQSTANNLPGGPGTGQSFQVSTPGTANARGFNADYNSGTSSSRSNGQSSFSHLNSLTSDPMNLVNSQDIIISDDGSIKTTYSEYFEQDEFSASDIHMLHYDAEQELIEFHKAKNVQVGDYYFHELAKSRFYFTNGRMTKADITFPWDNTIYHLPNPLSQDADNVYTISNIQQQQDSDNDGIIDEVECKNLFNIK